MHAAIYVRVSTDDQVKGASLPEQERRCRELVEREGWELVGVFSDDGVSASQPKTADPENRPAFAKLLASGAQVLVAHDLDRVVRSDVWFGFRESHDHLRIVTLDGLDTSRDDYLSDGVRVLVAADEARKILKRTMRSRVAVARSGRWPGGKPPYGMRVSSEHELVLNDDEAAIALDMVAAVLDGVSTAKLASRLNADERYARPKKAGAGPMRWNSLSVRRVLRNSSLKGIVVWTSKKAVELGLAAEDETFPIRAPELIAPETWDALQTKLDRNISEWQTTKIATPKQYPLSGRLFTTEGHSMAGAYNRFNDRRRYRCSGRNSRWPEERARHPKCHEVQAAVVEDLV